MRRQLLQGALGTALLPWVPLAPAAPAEAPGFASNFEGMRLLDQDARPFDFSKLRGRVLLVNFVYTGCSTVCPVQTRALVEMKAALPRAVQEKVHLVSISVDPRGDSPSVLKTFAQRMGAHMQNWSFVTGREQDVELLSQRLRLFRPAQTKRPDDHATSLWVVDRKGRLVQRYAGNPPDKERLIRELSVLTESE